MMKLYEVCFVLYLRLYQRSSLSYLRVKRVRLHLIKHKREHLFYFFILFQNGSRDEKTYKSNSRYDKLSSSGQNFKQFFLF